jgi:hypothetical protein
MKEVKKKKPKKQQHYTIKTVPKSNRNIVERVKINALIGEHNNCFCLKTESYFRWRTESQ